MVVSRNKVGMINVRLMVHNAYPIKEPMSESVVCEEKDPRSITKQPRHVIDQNMSTVNGQLGSVPDEIKQHVLELRGGQQPGRVQEMNAIINDIVQRDASYGYNIHIPSNAVVSRLMRTYTCKSVSRQEYGITKNRKVGAIGPRGSAEAALQSGLEASHTRVEDNGIYSWRR